MADLRNEDFRHFVCVESGTVRAPATGGRMPITSPFSMLDLFAVFIVLMCMQSEHMVQLLLEQRGPAARALRLGLCHPFDSAI
jgi:hypothetical protein